MYYSFSRLLLVRKCCKSNSRRLLSSTEVSTALRPFYFLVHPDLFGKYPQEQTVNEKSLKTLKNYVDTMINEKKRPNPKDVQFFVKPRTVQQKEKNILRSVQIRLVDTRLRETVLTILRAAELPTGFVDAIPDRKEETIEASEGIFSDPLEDDEPQTQQSSGFSSTDKNQPLLGWLQANIDMARQRLSKHEPIRLETERLQGEICYKYQLEDILWDCGWETVHRRGVVEAFHALVLQYPEVREIIRGRTIVFGKNSGVSITGQIILYSGEVRNNWLNVIKTTPDSDKLLLSLPMWQKTLSQSLRGIQIVTDPGNIVMVGDHRVHLRQLVTALGDYKARRSLPSSWPEDMSYFKLEVESDASALMLSPEGVFILPASTPGFLIVDFISKGMSEAMYRMSEAANMVVEEAFLVSSCINELGLIQLDRDDSTHTKHMVSCCTRLLRSASRLRHLTHGNHLIVARYYMVKSDGVICIPWDLVLDTNSDDEDKRTKEKEPILHLTMY